MCAEFKLIYWPLPFRGNFALSILEYQRVSYELSSTDEVRDFLSAPIDLQPIPGMAPPVLLDIKRQKCINQMPAVVWYLGGIYDLLPRSLHQQVVAMKLLLDCNDLLSELTRANGAQMWNRADWIEFRRQRWVRWLQIFSKHYDHSSESQPFILADKISIADFAIYALFATLMRCMPQFQVDIEQHAKPVFRLCQYVNRMPQMQNWQQLQQSQLKDQYCGGQIEQSLRQMLAADEVVDGAMME